VESKDVEINYINNNKACYFKSTIEVNIGTFNKINYKMIDMTEWGELKWLENDKGFIIDLFKLKQHIKYEDNGKQLTDFSTVAKNKNNVLPFQNTLSICILNWMEMLQDAVASQWLRDRNSINKLVGDY
jgi:hypothetical protein